MYARHIWALCYIYRVSWNSVVVLLVLAKKQIRLTTKCLTYIFTGTQTNFVLVEREQLHFFFKEWELCGTARKRIRE